MKFVYRGKEYKIQSNDGRDDIILSDFEWCMKNGDWDTISNRITNGLMWGWLTEKNEGEDEKGFW